MNSVLRQATGLAVMAGVLAMGSFCRAEEAATVSNGMIVSFQYQMFADGKKVGESTADKPMKYLHGEARGIVASIAEKLEGKKVGDEVKFSLPPEKAFGPVDPEEVQTIAKAKLPTDHTFNAGDHVAVATPFGALRGVVKEVKADGSIVVDFNHPLAGKTVEFEVKILGIEKAQQ